MSVEPVAAPPQIVRPRTRLIAVVAGLTAANVLGAALGFITGPLQARALGAAGRGDLQAILVPLGLAPYLLSLGIPAFANRELPRMRAANEVIGSLAVPLLAVGAVAVILAVPAADALDGGRGTVRLFLVITFLALPVLLLAVLLQSCLAGLQRWRRLAISRVIPFAVQFVAVVTLYASHRLTVATVAAFSILGSILVIVPALSLLREGGRPSFRLPLAKQGVAFGLKAWLGELAAIGNLQLDQLLMITLVSPRQLGLYAVASTLAGASSLVVGAFAPPLAARVAAGDILVLPRVLRAVMAGTTLGNGVLALATPILVPGLFGSDFHGAVTMALVLLAAAVPLGGARILSVGLQADGAPLIPSVAEGIALVVTAVGLAALLRPLGGLGAAIVSLAAYSSSFLVQLVMARRRTGVPLRAFLVPSRGDVRWARSLLRRASAA